MLSRAAEWRAIEPIPATLPICSQTTSRSSPRSRRYANSCAGSCSAGGAAVRLPPCPSRVFATLFGAVLHWLAAFVIVYAMAIIIDGLAPTFWAEEPAERDETRGLFDDAGVALGRSRADPRPRLPFASSRSSTVSTSFWLGLPILMKPPPDRTGPYARGDRLRDRAVGRRRRDHRAGRIGRGPRLVGSGKRRRARR